MSSSRPEDVRATSVQTEVLNEKEIRTNFTEIIISEFSMLATGDDLIKLVEKRVEAISNYSFTNSKRIQLLKIESIDSFLYGETQLIYFNEIREHLKSRVSCLTLVLLSLGEGEVTPTMYERHLAKLYERGIASKQSHQMHNEFPPIVIKNLNQDGDSSRGTKLFTNNKSSELKHENTPRKLNRLASSD